MNKKKGIAFYLRLLTAVLGLLGVITFLLSNTVSAANALSNTGSLCGLAVLGLVCTLCTLCFSGREGQGEVLGALAAVASVVCYTWVIGRHINGRILLFSGLFTWNSMNMEGWRVFYLVVASSVCFLVADVLLMVSGFLRDAAEPVAAEEAGA